MGETVGLIILDGVIGIIVLVVFALGIGERMTRPLWNRRHNRPLAQMSKEQW